MLRRLPVGDRRSSPHPSKPSEPDSKQYQGDADVSEYESVPVCQRFETRFEAERVHRGEDEL